MVLAIHIVRFSNDQYFQKKQVDGFVFFSWRKNLWTCMSRSAHIFQQFPEALGDVIG